MKLTIISGSPKGKESVTLQYLLYLQKHYPKYKYETFHVGQTIKSIEKNPDKFQAIIDSVKSSDAVFWITPIYYFLIPSQLKRFIELISERGVESAFKGKYATAVSTSIRFFDTTAHHYLHAVCDDLKMKYVGFNSLDMWDIFSSSKRKQFLYFAENLFSIIKRKEPVSIQYLPLSKNTFSYSPGKVATQIDNSNKKIVVLTDEYNSETNLGKMINRFSSSFTQDIELVEISKLDIKGGCLGCINCGYDNKCIYKDEFTDFWKNTMKKADIIIFAGEIKDRYLSAQFKKVFDRSFFMNHRPYITGKQMGFLISGPFRQVANLNYLFSAYVESQNSNLLDFVTDEYDDSVMVDKLIQSMAVHAVTYSDQGYIRPHTFYKEGGLKIFRDDVYGRLRSICQADHRWYRDNGIYDTFPQKNKFTKKMNRKFMFLTRFKGIRKKFYKVKDQKMLQPIQKIIADPDK
ncbi:MAG: NAD(P)H-dependent oxidoreductase [Desulfobacterales bacterium]|nr:NAD(P)H-dependent oxidoreductase [Desulfobacterales bacterium]